MCWREEGEEPEDEDKTAGTKMETEEDEEEFRLKDILPDSLERLHIWGSIPDDKESRKRILE